MKGALYILWNKGIGKCGCANHDNVTKSFLHTAAYALTGMVSSIWWIQRVDYKSHRSKLTFTVSALLARLPRRREGATLSYLPYGTCLCVYCQPSIQKLVSSVANDCLSQINEHNIHSEAYSMETPRVDQALHDLESEFSETFYDQKLLEEALYKGQNRFIQRNEIYHRTV